MKICVQPTKVAHESWLVLSGCDWTYTSFLNWMLVNWLAILVHYFFFLAIYYSYNACSTFLNSCNAFRSLWDWTAEHCEPNGSSYGTFIHIHNLHLCHKQSLKYLFGLAFSLCLFFFTADATKFVWDCLNQDDDELLGLLGNQTPLRDCRDFFADLGGTKLFVRPITIATTLECIA